MYFQISLLENTRYQVKSIDMKTFLKQTNAQNRASIIGWIQKFINIFSPLYDSLMTQFYVFVRKYNLQMKHASRMDEDLSISPSIVVAFFFIWIFFGFYLQKTYYYETNIRWVTTMNKIHNIIYPP